MPIRTLTKSEFRQKFTEDDAFVWFRQTMNDHFDLEKRLLRAQDPETLWQLKGIASVLTYINDCDKLLDHFDTEENEQLSD